MSPTTTNRITASALRAALAILETDLEAAERRVADLESALRDAITRREGLRLAVAIYRDAVMR